MQIGFFEIGDDVGPMNAHGYRPNEFVTNGWVFEGLTAWDSTSLGPDGRKGTSDDGVVGALAVSWTTNKAEVARDQSNAYTIDFKLREGVTFHDGEQWDANAAAANFDNIMGGATKSFAGFHDWYGLPGAIKEWKAIDKYTFRLTFTSYYEPALRELTFIRPFRMMSPKVLPSLAAGGISCGAWRQGAPRKTRDGLYTCRGVSAPIGTGPYLVTQKLLKDSTTGATRALPAAAFNASCYAGNKCQYGSNEYVAEVHFQKFAAHRSNPSYDKVILRAYATQASIKAALVDGSLDVAYGLNVLTPSAFVSLATDGLSGGVSAHTSNIELNTRALALNSAGVLNTPDLRKVIMGLIDRESLYQAELGDEDPMDRLFNPDLAYCNVPLSTIKTLAASTTKKPSDINKPLTFVYLKDVPHQNIIASQVIADLYTAGITVIARPMEKGDYNAAMDSWLGPDYDGVNGTISFDIAYTETWGPSYDAVSKLFDATYDYGSGEADAVVTSNMATVTKAQLNTLVSQIGTTIDDTRRQELYTQVLTSYHNEAIFLPISSKKNIAVVNKRVAGFAFGMTEFDIPIERFYPAPPPPASGGTEPRIVAAIVIPCVLGFLAIAFVIFMIRREKAGEPVFSNLKAPLVANQPTEMKQKQTA